MLGPEQERLTTYFARAVFLLLTAVVPNMAGMLNPQTASAAQSHAGSYSRLVCDWDGACHTEARSTPWPFVTPHQCKMSSTAECRKWGAYEPGVW